MLKYSRFTRGNASLELPNNGRSTRTNFEIVERMAAGAVTNEELDVVMNLESKGRPIEDVVDFLESDHDKGGQDEKRES